MISLLMSTYNGEKYLIEQLESIMNQTEKIDEVLIIDDCSTDGTVKLVEEFIKKYRLSDFWKLSVNEHNCGWRKNFFFGVEKTRGDYIFFCDQDDVWFSDKIEKQKRILDENHDIMVVASPQILYYGGDYDNKPLRESFRKLTLKDNCSNFKNTGVPGCAMAIKRKYYDMVKKYYCEGWAHDEFFWEMSLVSDSLAFMDDASVLRRIHGDNTSRQVQKFKERIANCNSSLSSLEQIIKYLEDYSETVRSVQKKIEIIKQRKKAIEKRLVFLQERKLSYGFGLLIDKYHVYSGKRHRQAIKDFCYVLGLLKKE